MPTRTPTLNTGGREQDHLRGISSLLRRTLVSLDVMSSATPDAERTPEESSAAATRVRRWRQGADASGDLDEGQATELVRRSAQTRGHEPVGGDTAGIEEAPEDDHVVIEVGRWSEPAPTAEELAALEARRQAAEAAAAAATERVIAQAIATGLTDPDEPPDVRRGFLRRKTGYYSPAAARAVDPATAAAAAERARELKLPRKVRRELERATRQMTDAAKAADAARHAAEQAAAAHAAQAAQAEAAATQAVKGREAAEHAAHEHAVQARTEAHRRSVAEQLASETAEQMAAANADRLRVEEDARGHAAAAEAAQRARAKAEEAALRASLEREAAEARAQLLAASLEEARAALLEQTKATLAAEQARAAAPPPVAAPAPAPVEAPTQQAAPRATPPHRQPESRIKPEGVPELVRFRSPSSSAVGTVLLGIGALVAAGVAVYEAYLDQLTSTPGIVASAVTLLLVIVVGRAKGSAGQVWLEQGVLHVDEGNGHRRFDLTTPSTMVEMIGQPGDRRWKVLFLRKGMAPYEVTARMVEPTAFVEALRPWRPKLGG
ncbi:MAG: hypothetical protein QOD98_349 [Nocardioidaceae bacterium]|nr:hypothetical protein [Nocardioidaceae bacterium]